MSLHHSHVVNIQRAFFGTVSTRADAERFAAKLGSRQEFLAWLVLNFNPENEPNWLLKSIQELADQTVVTATTRRVESDYPLRQHESLIALERVLLGLIKSESEQIGPIANEAYVALSRYSSLNLRDNEQIRYGLGTEIR